ncbi:putative dehydrogenase [Labedella gwakjiensis]|uniref:Putative dehydrogenase n=1 Tax=Labedella gwakjiensis TaxID=390269 RepID=A0A2P8H042_9MICO|nr:Gfo/Idh/MocA family oxidoreductase [Labedella gwakjiensis]PSL39576.1 putative dehydrogenase [Labedella gwakjiensis]
MNAVRSVIVVGAGAMGRTWLDTIARRSDLHVSAVVDVVEGAARSAVEERGWDAPVFSTADGALSAVHADMLLNVTIPEAHLAVSSAALRAGVPVLSEKPVTPTVAEALQLADLSESTGVLLVTSQSRRFSPGISTFRDALQARGGAGQLDTRFFQNPRFGGFRDRMDHPLLVDMAIHSFDQARFLLDEDPESVYCEEFAPSWSWFDGGAAAEAIFRFPSGARFSYSGSWCADGLVTSWNGDWRGSAPDGTVTWDGEAEVVAQGRDDDPAAVPLGPAPDGEGLDAALAEFVAALDGGPVPSGEVHLNVWSLAMVEAAVQSADRGERIVLADVFDAARRDASAR